MENRVIRWGALAAPLMVAGAVEAGVVTSDGPDILLKTDSGFTAETADGAFKFDLGGRIMFDLDSADGIYNQVDNGVNGEPMEFRRIRVELSGTAYRDWHYVLKTELGDTNDSENGGANGVDEVSIAYTGWDLATLKAGRFNSPFGLEQLTSSKWIATPERSIISDFHPAAGKQQAIQVSGDFAGMFGWQLALVDAEKFDGSDGSKEFAHAARMSFSPVHDEGSILHFALAYFDANANVGGGGTEDTVFRTRLGVHTAEDGGGAGLRPRVRADLNHDETIGLEAAGVFGPFSLQGEYFVREMDVAGSALSPENKGYYLQGTWTLTGEPRSYKWKDGKFDAVKPKGKGGAWELVAKYESVESDLDVATVRDIEIELLTLGVNWYINKNVRVMLHYLDLSTDGLDTANATAIDAAGYRISGAGSGVGLTNPVTDSRFLTAGSDEDGNAVSARLQYVF